MLGTCGSVPLDEKSSVPSTGSSWSPSSDLRFSQSGTRSVIMLICHSADLPRSIALNAMSMHAVCTAVFVAVALVITFIFASIQTLDKIAWLTWSAVFGLVAARKWQTLWPSKHRLPCLYCSARCHCRCSGTRSTGRCSSSRSMGKGPPYLWQALFPRSDERHRSARHCLRWSSCFVSPGQRSWLTRELTDMY
jgi:hypothetical protein